MLTTNLSDAERLWVWVELTQCSPVQIEEEPEDEPTDDDAEDKEDDSEGKEEVVDEDEDEVSFTNTLLCCRQSS